MSSMIGAELCESQLKRGICLPFHEHVYDDKCTRALIEREFSPGAGTSICISSEKSQMGASAVVLLRIYI